jgi:hypothetical protein
VQDPALTPSPEAMESGAVLKREEAPRHLWEATSEDENETTVQGVSCKTGESVCSCTCISTAIFWSWI